MAKRKSDMQPAVTTQAEDGTAYPEPLSAPMYSASVVQFMRDPNDAYLTFIRPHPATVGNRLAAIPEPVATIHLSIATLKDLSILLNDAVADIEKAEGHAIETAFTRRREKRGS
jgi:hypothetical protein